MKHIVIFLLFLQSFIFAAPGVKDNEILIGQSCVLTGPTAGLGKELKKGAEAYFNYANENSLLTRKIRLITYDDGYEPLLCKKNTLQLVKNDKVFCLFSYVGTPTTEKILPIIDDTGIPLIAPFTGAGFLRDPKEGKRNVFNIRATYEQETRSLVKRFMEDLNVKKFAVFYQKDAYGKVGLMGTIKALNRYGGELVSSGTYIRNTCLINESLKNIHKANPEAVIMIGAYKPCATFIIESKKMGFNPYFANISFVGTRDLIKEVGKYGEGTFISQVVPSPEDQNVKIVKECTEVLGNTPSYGELEGFINAKLLVKAFQQTGKNITRLSFIDSFKTMKNLDLGGIKITFGNYDHQGLNQVFFTQVRKGKAVPVEKFTRF